MVFRLASSVERAREWRIGLDQALLPALRELQSTCYANIIRGAKPLENFEEFIRRWNAQGGAALTRGANELHDDVKWIFRQVGLKPRRQAG